MTETVIAPDNTQGPAQPVKYAAIAILAPYGRDAAVARELLAADGIAGIVVPSMDRLVALMRDQIGAVLLTEEALSHPGIEQLRTVLSE